MIEYEFRDVLIVVVVGAVGLKEVGRKIEGSSSRNNEY